MKKAGIIILNYGGNISPGLTLESLKRAENDTLWDAVVPAEGGPVGVNEAIRAYLRDDSITHICLLSRDVIVSHHWLDSLAADGLDAAGPVTNIAGTEQTIAVDIDPPKDEKSFSNISAFAWKRQTAYDGFRLESDMVAFFAVALTRKVVETVGLLDERFQNGYFADEDYCMRIKQADFKIHVLRDCYIHNFGAGPFSHILTDENFEDWQQGQGPFEEKWGIKIQRRGWKLLKSCIQDAEFLAVHVPESSWAQDMLVQGYADHFNLLREENPALRERYKIELPFRENARQIVKKIRRRVSPSLQNENPRRLRRMHEKEILERSTAVQGQALERIRQSGKKAICVFAPMFTDENVKEGYMQRVKAVDEGVLDGFFRVYIDMEKPRIAPRIESFGENHIAIWLSPADSGQAKALQDIIKRCGIVYIHSVMRILRETLPKGLLDTLTGENGPAVIWDVHGAVPEEYAMAGDYFRAQMAGEAEEFLAARARVSIVVTEAMKRRLEQKYGDRMRAAAITMPIFSDESLKPVDCPQEKSLRKGQPPLAVYAGSIQPWQKIDMMQELIERAGDICRYAIFTPKPDGFERLWGGRKYPAEMRVESKTPEQLAREYKACHFGFILRDDIAVNNVACPTKLIEYLQYGIVPVMSTPNIGDFTAMGMEYVDAEAFGRGDLPSEKERLRMAEKNYGVLKELAQLYRSGKQAAIGYLSVEQQDERNNAR